MRSFEYELPVKFGEPHVKPYRQAKVSTGRVDRFSDLLARFNGLRLVDSDPALEAEIDVKEVDFSVLPNYLPIVVDYNVGDVLLFHVGHQLLILVWIFIPHFLLQSLDFSLRQVVIAGVFGGLVKFWDCFLNTTKREPDSVLKGYFPILSKYTSRQILAPAIGNRGVIHVRKEFRQAHQLGSPGHALGDVVLIHLQIGV